MEVISEVSFKGLFSSTTPFDKKKNIVLFFRNNILVSKTIVFVNNKNGL